LDLPSGLNPDSGALAGACVRASVTVTYGWVKRGLVLEPGRSQVGKLVVADIGLPRIFAAELSQTADYSTTAELGPLLPWRELDSHKRSMGVTLIVAGSQAYAGAAALAARAAYRAGLGLVRAYVPQAVLAPLQSLVPECVAKAGHDQGVLLEADLEPILELARECQSLVLGPGLGREPGTQALVKALWSRVKQPMLVDADGLFALAQGAWVAPAGPRLLTPHDGELARFLKPGQDADFAADRLEAARKLALATRVSWLLKGPGTLVAGSEGRLSVNSTGGPELATAGSGDALAGLAGALLAMGLEPWDAGRLAAHWHGLAAEALLRQGLGQGLTATDLADNLPRVRVELAGLKR
jgi:NAD(P)H-hydrate epimerase